MNHGVAMLQPIRPVVRDADLYLPAVDLWLDPACSRQSAFVSHAHGDHVRSRHGSVLCTPATAGLIRLRMRRFHATTLEFNQKIQRKGYTIRLIPAGHILGSAQLVVESPGWRFVYTGDFKLTQSLTCPPAEVIPADCLLMESTFAEASYRFPPVARLRERIVAFATGALAKGKTPALLGYAVGKGPELVRILQVAGVPVVASSEIVRTVEVYRRFGVPFDPLEGWWGRRREAVLVTTPGAWARTIRNRDEWRVAIATGWSSDEPTFDSLKYDQMIPLSDHADWPGLWEFVERTRPRETYVVHGRAWPFARALRAKGYEAQALLTAEHQRE
jgi:Cft2 family RNA processing exonuclease